jgi:hypothetical protein
MKVVLERTISYEEFAVYFHDDKNSPDYDLLGDPFCVKANPIEALEYFFNHYKTILYIESIKAYK